MVKNKILKDNRLIAAILTFVAIFLSYVFSVLGILDTIELKSIDFRFEVRGELPVERSDIVIVAIDDQSFVSLNRKWPFPRSYFARAITNLTEAGAKLIIFDIEFTENDAEEFADDSSLVEATTRATDIIYAGKIVVEYDGKHQTVNQYVVKPLKNLLDAGADWAYANIGHDTDGFIRRYNLFQIHGNNAYFPLGIEAYRILSNTRAEDIIYDERSTFRLGNIEIPKFTYNSMFIKYYGPAGTFPTYSLANILDDAEFDLPGDEDTDIFEIHKVSDTFKDKIVFIGASAEELQDNKFTPFFNYEGTKRKMPGVEMHANALNTILNNDYIYPLNSAIQFLIVVILALLAVVCSTCIKPYLGIICNLLILCIYIFFSFFLFINYNILTMLALPILACLLNYGMNTAQKLLSEQREKSLYRKTFQHYIARSVVDTMLDSGELPKFGGERKELTVLFSDIRSFTSFSEKYSPEIVVNQLSEYLSEMVDVIFKHEGTLDKFVGDEVMALFGAPYYFENHAERACLTALDMMERLKYLQKQWNSRELESFHIGIGINTGNMIVGNLGSIQLFDYTVIGDEVNLGARLEGANKFYSTAIIISETTCQHVKDKAIVRELDYVCVKGKKKPVKIFELIGMNSIPAKANELLIENYTHALEQFRRRQWSTALKQFNYILHHYPEDGPSKLYTQRCLDYIEAPPDDNWNGVFEFKTK